MINPWKSLSYQNWLFGYWMCVGQPDELNFTSHNKAHQIHRNPRHYRRLIKSKRVYKMKKRDFSALRWITGDNYEISILLPKGIFVEFFFTVAVVKPPSLTCCQIRIYKAFEIEFSCSARNQNNLCHVTTARSWMTGTDVCAKYIVGRPNTSAFNTNILFSKRNPTTHSWWHVKMLLQKFAGGRRIRKGLNSDTYLDTSIDLW